MTDVLLVVSFICAAILLLAIVKVIKGIRKARRPVMETPFIDGIYEFTIPDKGWYNISLKGKRKRERGSIFISPTYDELILFNQSSRQPQKLIHVFWNETHSSWRVIQRALKLFIVKDNPTTHYRLEVKGADPEEEYQMVIHGSFLTTAVYIPLLVLSSTGMLFSLAYAFLPVTIN